MSIEISYELTGHGWADCEVRSGHEEAHLTASYLSDALSDLAAAVVSLLRGAPHSSAVFEEEPGRFTWRFESLSPSQARVRILKLITNVDSEAGPDGTLIFDAECEVRSLGVAVLAELERIHREVGPVAYRQRWIQHAFPEERLSELRTLVRQSATTQG